MKPWREKWAEAPAVGHRFGEEGRTSWGFLDPQTAEERQTDGSKLQGPELALPAILGTVLADPKAKLHRWGLLASPGRAHPPQRMSLGTGWAVGLLGCMGWAVMKPRQPVPMEGGQRLRPLNTHTHTHTQGQEELSLVEV